MQSKQAIKTSTLWEDANTRTTHKGMVKDYCRFHSRATTIKGSTYRDYLHCCFNCCGPIN